MSGENRCQISISLDNRGLKNDLTPILTPIFPSLVKLYFPATSTWASDVVSLSLAGESMVILCARTGIPTDARPDKRRTAPNERCLERGRLHTDMA